LRIHQIQRNPQFKKKMDAEYNTILKNVKDAMGNQDSTTNSKELDVICNKLFGNRYEGTYPWDTAARILTQKFKSHKNVFGPQMMIVNTDPHYESGTHWIALRIENPIKHTPLREICMYDSFGRPIKRLVSPLYEELTKTGYCVTQTYQDAEQYKEQQDCGQRCVAWLLFSCMYGLDEAKRI